MLCNLTSSPMFAGSWFLHVSLSVFSLSRFSTECVCVFVISLVLYDCHGERARKRRASLPSPFKPTVLAARRQKEAQPCTLPTQTLNETFILKFLKRSHMQPSMRYCESLDALLRGETTARIRNATEMDGFKFLSLVVQLGTKCNTKPFLCVFIPLAIYVSFLT